MMVSKFWHPSICGAVKVFLKTSCTQRVRSLKKIILQTSIEDQLNLTVHYNNPTTYCQCSTLAEDVDSVLEDWQTLKYLRGDREMM